MTPPATRSRAPFPRSAPARRTPGDRSPTGRALAAAWLALMIASAVVGPFALSGCAPIIAVAAVGGTALVVTDRRSTGAQVDDQSIELQFTTLGNQFGADVHLNATSYNGVLLLTGEVPSQKVIDDIVALARATNRVREVRNEIAIAATTRFTARSNDALITSKVKTNLFEQNKVEANHVKVVTERSVVFLMGILTHAEGDAAARTASLTSGVARVVKMFEYSN